MKNGWPLCRMKNDKPHNIEYCIQTSHRYSSSSRSQTPFLTCKTLQNCSQFQFQRNLIVIVILLPGAIFASKEQKETHSAKGGILIGKSFLERGSLRDLLGAFKGPDKGTKRSRSQCDHVTAVWKNVPTKDQQWLNWLPCSQAIKSSRCPGRKKRSLKGNWKAWRTVSYLGIQVRCWSRYENIIKSKNQSV